MDRTASASVVIVTRDQAHLLADAVAAVRAQDPVPSDILVIDDGSRDQTAAVAALLGVRIFHQTRRGFAAACNTGLKAARGTAVAFLDAGARLPDGMLAAGLIALARHPKAPFALGRGIESAPSYREEALFSLLVRDPDAVTPAAALFRRQAVLEAGGFDERLRHYALQELVLRLVSTQPAARHDKPVPLEDEVAPTGASSERLGEWLEALSRHRTRTTDEPVTSMACRQSLALWIRRHRQHLAASVGRDLLSAERRPAAWRGAGLLLRCW
jgi:hypothetical protein